jgi:hypothetical protein
VPVVINAPHLNPVHGLQHRQGEHGRRGSRRNDRMLVYQSDRVAIPRGEVQIVQHHNGGDLIPS